ncbi:hypothetical protein pipiens_018808 [Culex pipiens pipiens]|uniref:Uncharacterized protein n=1 Tax=Culex pipiens pipiens TaxID=38569 RepID=A0ABD1DY20_CULPP
MEPGASVNPLLLEECNQVSLLHKAIKLQHERKSEIVKFLIESNLVECDQRDADNKTATEVVLTQLGDRKLAKLMVTAELVNLSDERSFYVMIRRGSVPVYKLFLECKSFDGEQIFRRVSNAMIELNARQVLTTMEMEVFVQYQLAHFAHNNLYGDIGGSKDPNEWRTHFAAIEEHWQVLKKKFGDRNYANVDNEFLFRIKAIHNHLYFVKDKRFLKHLPVMEATFCLAILVTIFERGQKFEMFKFLINKRIEEILNTMLTALFPDTNKYFPKNSVGQTPLHLALIDKDAEKALYLMKFCVDQDLRSPEGIPAAELPNGLGQRPLHLAVMSGKFEVVRFLVERCKVDLRALDAVEKVPVSYALVGGHMGIAKLLLECDPGVINIPDSLGQTLAHNSAIVDNAEVVQAILPYGVDLFALNKKGENSVKVAMENKSFEWLKVVFDYARSHKIVGLLRHLDEAGVPALHYTLLFEEPVFSTLIVEYEINASLSGPIPPESLQKLKELLTARMTDEGYTPLHVATRIGKDKSIKFILKCQNLYNEHSNEKLNLFSDQFDLTGRSPLDYALDMANESLINMLLDNE